MVGRQAQLGFRLSNFITFGYYLFREALRRAEEDFEFCWKTHILPWEADFPPPVDLLRGSAGGVAAGLSN